MVEIRTLRPMVRISMPVRPEPAPRLRHRRFAVIVRRRVDFPAPTPQPTPCVLWQGTTDKYGYGVRQVLINGKWKVITMHRWVMQKAINRPLMSAEVVLHACDNRLCYRYDHLSVGTIQDNNADMFEKGRASPPPRNVFHGASHPMAKLTASQVLAIRHRAMFGESRKNLAERFEVTEATIGKILRGERWAPK